MANIKTLIVDTALELLAKHERVQDSEQFVTAEDVANCVRIYKRQDVTAEYVSQVLGGEFASKFNGKKVIYFLRVK